MFHQLSSFWINEELFWSQYPIPTYNRWVLIMKYLRWSTFSRLWLRVSSFSWLISRDSFHIYATAKILTWMNRSWLSKRVLEFICDSFFLQMPTRLVWHSYSFFAPQHNYHYSLLFCFYFELQIRHIKK
jgi:hypothetical protein